MNSTVRLLAGLAVAVSLAACASSGVVTTASRHDADETLSRLERAVAERGFTVVTKIDHAAAARQAGLDMRYSTLLIFGNPAAGTPAMIEAPTLAIDLPLKALVWDDLDGRTWVSTNAADYLFRSIYRRHGAPASPQMQANVDAALTRIVEAATE